MLPQPNVVVKKSRRGTTVEVGGIPMAGVTKVETEHTIGESGMVTIHLTGRMVEFDQRHDSVDAVTAAIMGKIGQLVKQTERDRTETINRENDLREENDRLRVELAAKQRIRVQAGSRK
jgi:hypothetical protein